MGIVANNIRRVFIVALLLIMSCGVALAQSRRSAKSYVKGGMLIRPDTTKLAVADSLALGVDSLGRDSLYIANAAPRDGVDSLLMSEAAASREDSLSRPLALKGGGTPLQNSAAEEEKRERKPFFSDSMSISKMCYIAAVLPGYGQIYNKQYWKLPICYGAIGASLALYINENNNYKPLKTEYDNLLLKGVYRTPELNEAQAAMIKSNTRRQIYLGATIASYILTLGDAAINYSTNDVSDVKKATTLAMICPGAGQIYNKSYWRLPFVLGMFSTTIYVMDWNNRGYDRFSQAYALRYDFDKNPDKYPNGSVDEFGGRYPATYLKSLRDSYRRNRDLAIILTAGAYIFQIIDAHVDAHLKDFDISDDLSLNMEPVVGYTGGSNYGVESPTYGVNLNFRF